MNSKLSLPVVTLVCLTMAALTACRSTVRQADVTQHLSAISALSLHATVFDTIFDAAGISHFCLPQSCERSYYMTAADSCVRSLPVVRHTVIRMSARDTSMTDATADAQVVESKQLTKQKFHVTNHNKPMFSTAKFLIIVLFFIFLFIIFAVAKNW